MKKKVALLLVGVSIFLMTPVNVIASEISHTTALEVYEEDEEIPFDVILAANTIGKEYDICPELLEAIAYRESRCTTDVKNGTCIGIM